MSTILKALEKNKHHPQTLLIDKSTDRSWKLLAAAALLVIALLLVLVLYLLFKPAERVIANANNVAMAASPIQTASVKVEPVILQQPQVKRAREAIHSVSEIDFKTKPLPKLQQKSLVASTQTFISAEKNTRNEKSEVATIKTAEVENSLALADVPSDLQQRFALAVELEQGQQSIPNQVVNDQPVVESDISQMPAQFQYQVPVMSYDSHVYSTKANDRWIRINGVDMRVGDYVGAIELVDIMPQQSVFRLGKQRFTLESLKDWKG